MAKILIIEDEPGLQITLEDRLRAEGHEVDIRGEGLSGQEEALKGDHELILLDVMLPGRDGFQICQNLRNAGVSTPILMLTARSTSIDTVMGLRLGADDYLAKPFDMQVLLARISALLRRSAAGPADRTKEAEYHFGEFFLDTMAGVLYRGETLVDLNSQEYRLLKFLVENAGRILSRDELLDGVWGYDQVTTTRTVDVHIAWLRQKLDEQSLPRHIRTVRGRGYKFSHV